MKAKFWVVLAALIFSLPAGATIVDFTGGTVNNNYANQYLENGFQVDVIGSSGAYFGNYYGAGNDVIHSHWLGGCCGNVTDILISKIGGGAFDMNYFILASNTDTGGGAANGFEQAWIQALGGVNNGYTQLLPPENWGFPATQVFLGSQFDDVTSVRFFVTNGVDCFGMDEFYIDEPAPPPLPEPLTSALLGIGLIGLLATRRRTSK